MNGIKAGATDRPGYKTNARHKAGHGSGVSSVGPRNEQSEFWVRETRLPGGAGATGRPVCKANAGHEARRGPKPLERFGAKGSSADTGKSAVLILHQLARRCKWLLCMMAAILCGGTALWFFTAPILRPQDTLALWLLAAVAGWLAQEAYQAAKGVQTWEP